MTLSDPYPRFQGHGVTIDALDVLCAQLTHDLFAIAEFLIFIILIKIYFRDSVLWFVNYESGDEHVEQRSMSVACVTLLTLTSILSMMML